MATRFARGDRVVNKKGRPGVVIGSADGFHVRVRYDDGSRDTWIQAKNLHPEEENRS